MLGRRQSKQPSSQQYYYQYPSGAKLRLRDPPNDDSRDRTAGCSLLSLLSKRYQYSQAFSHVHQQQAEYLMRLINKVDDNIFLL